MSPTQKITNQLHDILARNNVPFTTDSTTKSPYNDSSVEETTTFTYTTWKPTKNTAITTLQTEQPSKKHPDFKANITLNQNDILTTEMDVPTAIAVNKILRLAPENASNLEKAAADATAILETARYHAIKYTHDLDSVYTDPAFSPKPEFIFEQLKNPETVHEECQKLFDDSFECAPTYQSMIRSRISSIVLSNANTAMDNLNQNESTKESIEDLIKIHDTIADAAEITSGLTFERIKSTNGTIDKNKLSDFIQNPYETIDDMQDYIILTFDSDIETANNCINTIKDKLDSPSYKNMLQTIQNEIKPKDNSFISEKGEELPFEDDTEFEL